MSRVANQPVPIPKGVEIQIEGAQVSAKGPKGNLAMEIHPSVELNRDGDDLKVRARDSQAAAMAGTMRALLNNLLTGVGEGFQRKLQLVGVGYRAQMQGRDLQLALGFSHPIQYTPPPGVTVEATSQTEVVVSGADKQQVGQAAAVIRAFRPPEPYKGKGVRYADEHIVRKEAKKA